MKNKDDLYFYSSLLEVIIDEVPIYYKDIKNKKLKNILDKCGFKWENVENSTVACSRGYSLDENIKKFYDYIK